MTAALSPADLARGETLTVKLEAASFLAGAASLFGSLTCLRHCCGGGFLAVHACADVVEFESFVGLGKLQFHVLLAEGESFHFVAKSVVVDADFVVELLRRLWNIAVRMYVLHG